MRSMKRLKRYLTQTRGESFIETLFATLISLFAILLLATLIIGSTNLIGKSKALMKDYYERNNEAVVNHTTAEGETKTHSYTGTVSVIVKNDLQNVKLDFGLSGDGTTSDTRSIKLYVNEGFSGQKIVSYEETEPAPAGG